MSLPHILILLKYINRYFEYQVFLLEKLIVVQKFNYYKFYHIVKTGQQKCLHYIYLQT